MELYPTPFVEITIDISHQFMGKYAPVRIPTLCRSAHFIRLIESLKRNTWAKYTEVYVGLDYPPNEKYRKGWQEICNYVDTGNFSIFSAFHVIRRTENLGVRRNLWDLSRLIYEYHDRMITLEDDTEVSPNFLEYMNKCLDVFENDSDVVLVSGYSYPVKWRMSEGATCMKQDFNASTWGQGTWKAKEYEYTAFVRSSQTLKCLSRVIKNRIYNRMINACLREYIQAALFPKKAGLMIRCSDIGMRAYLPIAGKFCISPIMSKVRNHGFDGSGFYCQDIIKTDGQTAGSYNYPEQPIDESDSFEISLNDVAFLEENRKRLNAFDYRSPNQMRKTHILLWLMEHWGIWAAKCYMYFTLPYDFTCRAYRKVKRMLKK